MQQKRLKMIKILQKPPKTRISPYTVQKIWLFSPKSIQLTSMTAKRSYEKRKHSKMNFFCKSSIIKFVKVEIT